MPFAYLCDFDGTISPQDIGAALVRRFSQGRDADREALLRRWFSGGLGHRELTEAECGLLTVTEDQALEFTRTFKLDPHFAPFVREALGRGDAVMVVSEGFGFYVRDHLHRAGFPDLPWAANTARFDGARVTARVSVRGSRVRLVRQLQGPARAALSRQAVSRRARGRRALGPLRGARGGHRAGARRPPGVVPPRRAWRTCRSSTSATLPSGPAVATSRPRCPGRPVPARDPRARPDPKAARDP